MKQFSLLEIISNVVLLATVVVDFSRVFHAVDSAALQVTHRCTPAPDGTLAAPAALPTVGLLLCATAFVRAVAAHAMPM